MTPWPAEPEPIEASNRETVERLGGVAGERPAADTTPARWPRPGRTLPLDDWL